MIESKCAPVAPARPEEPAQLADLTQPVELTQPAGPVVRSVVTQAGKPPARSVHTRTERRYERKMRVAGVKREWIEMLIWEHPAHLVKAYASRYVNNLYLDTLRKTFYTDHVDGVPRRKKVRVRWYGPLGDDLFEPQLEIKSRDGWTMTKQVYPLQPSCLDQMLSPGGVRGSVDSSRCPPSTGELVANLQPTLINRYLRRYFETRDGLVRVTIDTEMNFYHANRFGAGVRFGYADHAVIVEIKFDESAIAEGTAVAAHFPLPLNKNSKYVNGILLLHGRC